jgi:hypothetical protein
MAKSMIIFAAALALSAMSAEVLARGGGGGGGGSSSKSAQSSPGTMQAPRSVSAGMPTGKRMHKPITVTKEWGGASSKALLRGNNTNNQKGGRYLASRAAKRSGKLTPDKVEAGSENIQR